VFYKGCKNQTEKKVVIFMVLDGVIYLKFSIFKALVLITGGISFIFTKASYGGFLAFIEHKSH